MPNWCANNLELHSNNLEKLEEIRKAFCEDKLLQYLVPMPEELKNQNIDSLPTEEGKKLGQENITKYGSQDWYYWAFKNWGTKWDVGAEDTHAYENDDYSVEKNTDINNDFKYSLSLVFDSAWSPPRDAIKTLTNHDVEFKLTYYEGGVGFCGFVSNNDEDDWDLSSGEVTEAPEWIREEFGIDEHQSQLDDDEEDTTVKEI